MKIQFLNHCLFSILVLLGCVSCASSRPGCQTLESIRSVPKENAIHPLLVVTNRAPEVAPRLGFSAKRQAGLTFQRLEMSVPPTHQTGGMEHSGSGRPDPAKHICCVSNEDLAGPKGFKAELQRRIQASPTREVAIFVHGFNTIYPEAVLFATQLVHDTKFKGVPVLFTWPSEGRVFGYMYDRDSVLTSRDHLDATIRMAAAAGAKRIMLLAHSMGSMLTMETLRQAGFRGDASYGGKLQQVMLASPDISIDVFISQRSRIGPLPRIVVVLSRDDRALSVSKWLSGEVERLGSFRDDALLAKMDVSVVDLTEVSVGNITRHSKFAHLPELLNGLARHAEQDGEPTGGPGVPFTVKKVVLGTMGTANIILSSPFRALEKVLGEGSNVR